MAEIIGVPGGNKASVAVDVVRHDDAVARVRALEVQISAAEGNACRLRMAQGDILIPIRDGAAHGRWLAFLADCGLQPRNAQIAIQLAEKRTEIEAANAKSSSHLSIAATLRLIRPKKPTKPCSEPKVATDPYSVEALAKLPPVARARLVANLGITRADVPSPVAADLVQHAVAQAREVAGKDQAALKRCVANIRTILTTGASAPHRIEDIRAAVERLDSEPYWVRPMAAESLFPKPPPEPSQEELQKRLLEQLSHGETPTEPAPTKH